MARDDTTDVIVVGGGVMGCAAAYHLAKDGGRVLLIEQFGTVNTRGAARTAPHDSFGSPTTPRGTCGPPPHDVLGGLGPVAPGAQGGRHMALHRRLRRTATGGSMWHLPPVREGQCPPAGLHAA
jgi:choline dehydrogenase-like flavoprotein